MTNEEKYLNSKMGKDNPFRVPEGYFDNFAAQLMEKLPAAQMESVFQRPAMIRRLRSFLYAAAFLLLAVMSVTLFYQHAQQGQEAEQLALTDEAVSTDAYFDEATDYAMLDNYDIYACLASE